MDDAETILRWFRAGLRLLLVSSLTLVALVVLFVGQLPVLPASRARARWRSFVMRYWGRMILAALGVDLTVDGEAPAKPFLLVSNHLSYLDIMVIGSQVGVVFVAKSELASWPFIGFICRAANTIFIDRNLRRDLPRVMREIDRQLELGQGVVLFAEGTSSKGATVLPFRPSLLEPAVRSHLPVSYAALSYRTPEHEQPAHLAVCWWGGMDFSPHAVNLATLRQIEAKLVFGDRQLHDTDRKRLAERLRAEVLERFEPVVHEASS